MRRLALIALAACGGTAAQPPDAMSPPDAGPDAPPGPTRGYALASSGAQIGLQPFPGIRLGLAHLPSDADAVLVHQEFYGLPWEAFENGTEPPAEWVAAMDELVLRARSVGPVFLSLQLVSGNGRRFLADRAVITQGTLVSPQSGWSTECYDFSSAPDAASKRAGYLAYVDWMARRFQPRWLNVAIEMNFFAACGDGPWNALVEVERAAYDAAKAVVPDALVFPSIQIDVLYGWAGCASPNRDDCFDASYAKLANLKRDRFAVTSFPYLIAALRDPAALPDDWLTRAGDRGGERTVIAETGWLGASVVARRDTQCIEAIPSSEATQLAWFDHVMAETERADIELVTWVSNQDLVPATLMTDCPCDFDADWCGFLDLVRGSGTIDQQAGAEYAIKQFGAMGIRHHDGTPRSELFSRWQAARAPTWLGKRGSR